MSTTRDAGTAQPHPEFDEDKYRAAVRKIMAAMTPEELDDFGRLLLDGEIIPPARFDALVARLNEDGQR